MHWTEAGPRTSGWDGLGSLVDSACMRSNISGRVSGFTLIELTIVVLILGILAALVIPKFTMASEGATKATFESQLRDLTQAETLYFADHGDLPAQAARDRVPSVLLEHMKRKDQFPLETPLGGFWHIGEFNDINKHGVGVWWPSDQIDTQGNISVVDASIDDGDPSAGRFQLRDNARYYWLIE